MPRLRDEPPVERVHILLYKHNHEELKARYADTIGVGPAVRHIVDAYLKRLEMTHPLAQVQSEPDPFAELQP